VWCGAEAYPGHRQPLVLNALDGCGLEGAVTHVWAQHQVGIGGDDPPLHCPSNDSAHSRNTKCLINDELSILLHLVMPACMILTICSASQQCTTEPNHVHPCGIALRICRVTSTQASFDPSTSDSGSWGTAEQV